jgi:hypothetical protein
MDSSETQKRWGEDGRTPLQSERRFRNAVTERENAVGLADAETDGRLWERNMLGIVKGGNSQSKRGAVVNDQMATAGGKKDLPKVLRTRMSISAATCKGVLY